MLARSLAALSAHDPGQTEISLGLFSVTDPTLHDPPNFWTESDPTWLADKAQNNDPHLTQPDELMMTPKIKFSKYSFNNIHDVKLMFETVVL